MTRLAVAGNPRFEASAVEIERPGPSYTVDTLGDLLARHGPETELYVILGQDALLDLPNWKEPRRIVALAWLAVALRSPGRDLDVTDLEAAVPGLSRRLIVLPDVLRRRERDGAAASGRAKAPPSATSFPPPSRRTSGNTPSTPIRNIEDGESHPRRPLRTWAAWLSTSRRSAPRSCPSPGRPPARRCWSPGRRCAPGCAPPR